MYKILLNKLFVGLAMCLALNSVSAELPSQLSVDLQAMQGEFDASEAVLLQVKYTNRSLETIKLLTWGTALEGEINADFLSISINGRALPYAGRKIKRLPPTARDFVSIAPGQSASAVIDILDGYKVLLKGDYQVRYKSEIVSAKKSSGSVVSFRMSADAAIVAYKQPPIYANCNGTQVQQIDSALDAADTIARRARDDIRNTPISLRDGARRYREWFGAVTTSRWDTVQRGFDEIASATSNQRIGFDCACDINDRENTYAFVFPNDPFNMNVCPVFFRVDRVGPDSMSGTIIHELSHFTIVAGTEDFASNQDGIRSLAMSRPNDAVRAANAFEYFAENTPFLLMPTSDDLPPEPEPEPEPEPPVMAPIVDLILDE
jgi:peptidyl-Lys metalloendopeptidase